MAYGVFGGTNYQYGSKVPLKLKLYPPASIGTGGNTRPTEGKMFPRGK